MADQKLETLAAELADPSFKDAKGEWLSDRAVAEALNAKAAAIVRRRVPAQEVLAAVDLAEWELLSDGRRQFLTLVLSGEKPVDFAAPHVAAALGTCFPAGSSATGNALALVSQKQGSRAEVLLGEGAVVTVVDVERAKRVSEGKDPDYRDPTESAAIAGATAAAHASALQASKVKRG